MWRLIHKIGLASLAISALAAGSIPPATAGEQGVQSSDSGTSVERTAPDVELVKIFV